MLSQMQNILSDKEHFYKYLSYMLIRHLLDRELFNMSRLTPFARHGTRLTWLPHPTRVLVE